MAAIPLTTVVNRQAHPALLLKNLGRGRRIDRLAGAGTNRILVLQGHLHVSELLHWRGATFITGGAVCANWWRGPYFGTEEGFNAINLRRDRVEREYIDYGWQARCWR